MKINNLLIALLLLLSIAMGVVEFYLNGRGEFVTETTQTLWGLIFLVLSIAWAHNDTKHVDCSTSFDFGFFMYLFWPLVFPYYLLATRGIEGVIFVAGFLSLWAGPWLAGLVAYVYVYSA